VWEFSLVTTADAPPEQLWAAVGTETAAGRGRWVRVTVEDCSPPRRFANVARMPLVRVRTVHEFEPVGRGTRVRVVVQSSGPLGLLWGCLFGERHARGVAEWTHRFVGPDRQPDPAAAVA